MGTGRDDAWELGQRAWKRLTHWHRGKAPSKGRRADPGEDAVEALADINRIRSVLDRAEMAAVRAARRHGKSWAEIAAMLGITRQSAWERWRDLEPGPPPQDEDAPRGWVGYRPIEAAAEELIELRRRSSVVVPDVVGLSWSEATEALSERGFVAIPSDPDLVPEDAFVVTDQTPESGAKVPAGSRVRLWTERGGGSGGVREPRRPTPSPRIAREMREEPSGEAAAG